jgi:hypothetical protein
MKTIPLCWSYNDGGRESAGFRGTTGDCVVRAIAITSGASYIQVYEMVNRYGQMERKSKCRKGGKSCARTGVYRDTIRRIMNHLGYEWVSCMGIGTGCKTHLRRDELPMGKLIVSVSKHLVAVVDGIVQDTHDCTRGGNRCVYGYWIVK